MRPPLPRLTRCLAAGLLLGAAARADEPPAGSLPPTPPPELPAASVPAAAPVMPPAANPPAEACEPRPFDFSKVPPVRPLPRPGNFAPPPERPGYYSLVDVFRGEFREKPPKMPYAPISPILGSFFDADYRYLDDPKNTQHDWLDFLKRVRLGDDWLLSTGGEFRYRLMDEVDARLTGVNDNYHLIRTRVYGDAWYRDRLRLFIEFIEAHSFDNELPRRPIDQNPADFLNLFADVKVLERLGAPGYLRVGRQEMLYGSQRLISPLDWANTRRTFQGTKLFWQREKWDLDLFWVKPVPVDPVNLDWWDVNRDLTGVWATYKPKKGTTRDFYALNFHQSAPAVPNGLGGAGPLALTTFGTRWAGDKDGRWLYDLEYAIQTGVRANVNTTAYMATTGVGYRAKCLRMNPTAWVYYDFASGSPDPAAFGFNHTFNQLFPFGHYYLGFIDLVARQNIHDFNVHFAINPMPFVSAQFQYHHFALASPRDALYNAAGAPIRIDPTGASGSHVGDEFDFLANVHINRHHDVLFGFSYLVPGAFLTNAPPGSGGAPALYYVQYSYKW